MTGNSKVTHEPFGGLAWPMPLLHLQGTSLPIPDGGQHETAPVCWATLWDLILQQTGVAPAVPATVATALEPGITTSTTAASATRPDHRHRDGGLYFNNLDLNNARLNLHNPLSISSST